MKIMKCLELATGRPGGPVNQYLRDYNRATGFSTWTVDKAKALKFTDALEAMTLWKSVHEKEPVRVHDGKPNRPLTAFTISIEEA